MSKSYHQKISIAYEVDPQKGTFTPNSNHGKEPEPAYARSPKWESENPPIILNDHSNFAVFSGCFPRNSNPAKTSLVYDLTKYDIKEIVAGEDFAIFLTVSGQCYFLAEEVEERFSRWKKSMGIEEVSNGRDALLIPFTLDDPIEKVFCHSFCTLSKNSKRLKSASRFFAMLP